MTFAGSADQPDRMISNIRQATRGSCDARSTVCFRLVEVDAILVQLLQGEARQHGDQSAL